MKRALSLILALLMLLGAVGCGGSGNVSSVDTSAADTSADTSVDTDAGDDAQEVVLDKGKDTTGIDLSKIDVSKYNVISVEDYLDKTLAGHIAQYIGFLSGYEFASSGGKQIVAMPDSWFEICNGPYAEHNNRNPHGDKLRFNEQTGIWEVWNDDDFSIDILNQYIIRDSYEKYGTLSSQTITKDWVDYNVYDMGGGHRSYGAYGIFKSKGYLPPFSGMAEYGNKYAVNGEPYIANETLGMSYAGMTGAAVDVTGIFASVTSDRDPVIWAQFFSAMYAMAYFEDDISTLIEEARKVVPDGSVPDQVIDEVLALRKKYPSKNLWRNAVREAETLVHRHHYDLTSNRGETCINCSFILIGLLWGEGDFYETLKIISLAGHGGDSTTPVGVGIVAIINGMADIPEAGLAKTWQDGQGVVVNLPLPGYEEGYWMCALGLEERIKMADVVSMYQTNFESILAERGGFRCDGNYYIPKSEYTLSDTEVVLYEGFESGNLNTANKINAASVFTKTASDNDLANAFFGDWSLKLTGNPNSESGIYYTVTGLEVGAQYRYEAYVHSPTISTYLFARKAGESGLGQYATVYDSTSYYIKRSFVFTATASTMQIGVMIPEGLTEYKYSQIDELLVIKVEENEVSDKITLNSTPASDGKYSGKVKITVGENIGREVYLKLTFANTMGKNVDAAIYINGEKYASTPFHKTGKLAAEEGLDAMYIPIVLVEDSNIVELDLGKNAILIYDVSLVTVNTRCG